MCGIAGYFSHNNSINKQDLVQMTDALAHRGPDAAGYFVEEPVGLGHRRLKIIDLSEGANQPMHSHEDRYCMIYNGEVYNFQEIQQDLSRSWRTTSDTEVIIEAFVEWGDKFVNRLNGMFAIAIYDKQEQQLHLFRDRLGIKPIYYYYEGDTFVFASEIKALLQLPLIHADKKVNKEALNQYLHLGYIPEPNSIYENIHKFPAGAYACIGKEVFEIKQYWRLEEQVATEALNDEQVAKEQLNELVRDSVKGRLIADVPFGTFLSGGIDSSLVTAVAQSVSKVPINTFSIGFKESTFNESHHAKQVADHLGTKHHEFMVSHQEAIDLFEDIIDVYDEPFADSSSVPTMLVSKLARQHVTMTLSGDGGDETYLGYGFYNWAKRLENPAVKAFRKPISKVLSSLSNKYQRASHLFEYDDESTLKSHIFSQEQYYFSREEVAELLNNDLKCKFSLEEQFDELPRELEVEEQQALFDMKYYLKDDLLVKVDRASMRYSLENRVPLLDHRLVEFALNVHSSLKMRGGTLKYLLKQVLYDYVPASYFDRPKWGFGMPIGQWLKKELRHLVDDYLSEEVVRKAQLVDNTKVQRLISQYFGGKDYLYNRIWLLIILHRWYLKNFN